MSFTVEIEKVDSNSEYSLTALEMKHQECGGKIKATITETEDRELLLECQRCMRIEGIDEGKEWTNIVNLATSGGTFEIKYRYGDPDFTFTPSK